MSRQVILILLLISSAALAQDEIPAERTAEILDNARKLTAVDADGCLVYRSSDEIVVCGTPEIDRLQRLPFPELATVAGQRIREPLPKGNPAIVQQGRCYVTMDERNCFQGVSLLTVGSGGGVGGAAARLWQVVSPDIPDEDYVQQALIKPLVPEAAD
ncbi:hypothetical protein [Sphingorhabdus sp. YGSMI21]|uniref:hypothetical protein n=1 Tax=Sphingorhabdus sp. YGSMI21 TaxID=2077182 RepID=UPI000C1DF755|nr:hypothetical protein [Sphingorhabdus sp. YGSMI21]ATW03685.1 hypothetical protein CHN51_09170 [Sphingorhabdus sp. YGSMI21]